ncbi:hypothetical protein GCM10010302_75360 [Streptomyces polychromogenes]|uniref:TIGR02677 family protein n=1 Tax=Streptomyces polychromogenes TaxID=67342 RepID=A0ABN0W4X5_9ACTN
MGTQWWQLKDAELFSVFAESNPRRRALDTAVLAALLAGSTRGPTWTLSDIHRLLREVGYEEPIGNEDLAESIQRLIDAGHVVANPNYTDPVASYTDGLRRREAWSLTRRGRVVVAAVRDAQLRLERTMQLPARLLDSVEQTLRSLAAHHRRDAGMLAPVLAQVRTHLEQLQEASGDFYSAVGALTRPDVSDDDAFTANCRHILLALQQFAWRTEQSLGQVRAAFDEIHALGTQTVVRRALPGAGVLDVEAQDAWVAQRVRELSDLQAWLDPGGAVELLVSAAADAVHALLGAIDRRFHAATRGSDLGSDFRQVARMLHAQPDAPAAFQVFAAAFGLWPSRHPLTLAEDDVAPGILSASGSGRPVQVVLRRTQRGVASAGRPRNIPDLSRARRDASTRNREVLERLVAVTGALATEGRVPLSHFDDLDAEHTSALASLLDEALDAFDAAAGCGVAELAGARLTVWPGRTGRWVDTCFEEGVLTTVDLLVEVCTVTHESDEEAA